MSKREEQLQKLGVHISAKEFPSYLLKQMKEVKHTPLLKWTGWGRSERIDKAREALTSLVEKNRGLMDAGDESLKEDILKLLKRDIRVPAKEPQDMDAVFRNLDKLLAVSKGKAEMSPTLVGGTSRLIKNLDEATKQNLFSNPTYKTIMESYFSKSRPTFSDTAKLEAEKLVSQAKEPSFRDRLPKNLSMPLIALTIGGTAAASGIGDFLENKEKQQVYLKMLDTDKELKKLDKIMVLNYFNTLWDMNPTMAKQPAIAATFIKSHIEGGLGIPYQAATEILKARAEELKTKKPKGMGEKTREHVIESLIGPMMGLGQIND